MLTDVTSRVRDGERALRQRVAPGGARAAHAARRRPCPTTCLQQLYAIGLHLDVLQRHPERLEDEAEPVLSSLQDTITGLRASITGLLLAGDGTSIGGGRAPAGRRMGGADEHRTGGRGRSLGR